MFVELQSKGLSQVHHGRRWCCSSKTTMDDSFAYELLNVYTTHTVYGSQSDSVIGARTPQKFKTSISTEESKG